MNTCIVLMIVLKLIHVVYSGDYFNVTEYEIVPTEPYTSTDDRRILRTHQHEYTRWITTPFIVKVPDDTEELDETTGHISEDDLYRIPVTEYTRFVLPDVSRTRVGGRKYKRYRLSTPMNNKVKQEWSSEISTEEYAHKRLKRTPQMEYTRWTFDTSTSSEFIVKVPEDDEENFTPPTRVPTTMLPLPVTRINEKIVVGGAIVTPKRTTTMTTIGPIPPRDYTRFVPPAHDASKPKDTPERTPPTIFIEALKPDRTTMAMKRPIPNRNPLRDESPPAGPQFLPHSPVVEPRQFAHLEPVVFPHSDKQAHVTPPAQPSGQERPEEPAEEPNQPLDLVSPRGSLELDELNKAFKQFETDELNEKIVTRTTPNLFENKAFKHFETDELNKKIITRTTPNLFENKAFKHFETDELNKNIISRTTTNQFGNKAFKPFDTDELNEKITRTTTNEFEIPTRESKYDRQLLEAFHELVDEISKEEYTKDTTNKATTEKHSRISVPDLDSDKGSAYIEDKADNDVNDPIEDAYSEISKNLDSVELLTKDLMNVIDSEYPGIFNDSDANYGDIDYAAKASFRTALSSNDTLDDLKSIIIQEEPVVIPSRKKPDHCNVLDIKAAVLSRIPTLPEVNNRLKRWNEQSPIVKLFDITYGNLTFLEHPIYAMVIDDPSRGQVVSAKKSVMVVGGIQGRDHFAVAAAMYVLYQLIEKSDTHGELLTKYRFLVIPVFNPDGYDYSMTFAHRRDWTKNLRQSWDSCTDRDSCKQCSTRGISCTPKTCFGVNLDRNFEYQWLSRNELSGEHPCGDLYPGPRQISEPETIALTQYLLKLKLPIYAFITFKEGDVLGVLYPYSHTKRRRAHDNLFRQRADLAAAAAAGIDERAYVSGQSSEFLRLYAGGIEDWVDAHLGVDFTFSVMLNRPQDAKRPNIKTEFVVYEGYAALEALLLSKIKDTSIKPVAKMSESRQGVRVRAVKSNKQDKLYFTYTLSLLTIALCIFEIIK